MRVFELESAHAKYTNERQRLLESLENTADVLDEQTRSNEELSVRSRRPSPVLVVTYIC